MTAVAGDMGDDIAALVDAFCAEHLDEEYRVTCRELLGELEKAGVAMERAAEWAAGIVRTIGWVNVLDGAGEVPGMRLGEIDRLMGVAAGVGGVRSMWIREKLKIGEYAVRWTLPRKRAGNPWVWTVDVGGGRVVDVRRLPREEQVAAFEKGLVPFVWADRKR